MRKRLGLWDTIRSRSQAAFSRSKNAKTASRRRREMHIEPLERRELLSVTVAIKALDNSAFEPALSGGAGDIACGATVYQMAGAMASTGR